MADTTAVAEPKAPETTPATPAAPPPKKFEEDWFTNIKQSMGVALDPSKNDATAETVKLPERTTAPMSFGEQAMHIQAKEALAPTDKKEEPKPPVEPEKKPATPPTTPAAPVVDPPKVQVKPARADFVDPTPVPQAPQKQQQLPPDRKPDTAPVETDDDKFAKTLIDEERDEYELAVYASQQGDAHKSKPAEVLGFFRKVQQFLASNPTVDPASQDYQEFIDKNRPSWKPGERNRLNRKMIEDAAVKRVEEKLRSENTVEQQKTQAKLREVEARPVVEKNLERFTGAILGDRAAIGLPAEIEGISENVINDAKTMTPDQLAAAHPVEGPIVAQHLVATREFEKLVSGAVDFDSNNQNHQFLVRFLDQQEGQFSKAPEENRVVEGRSWVPRAQMSELLVTDPARARKHWTFSDDQVRKMLAFNAHAATQSRVDSFSKSGFKREKIQKPASTTEPEKKNEEVKTPAPAPIVPQTTASPQATVSSAPGAAQVDKPLTEGEKFIRDRLPGYKFAKQA